MLGVRCGAYYLLNYSPYFSHSVLIVKNYFHYLQNPVVVRVCGVFVVGGGGIVWSIMENKILIGVSPPGTEDTQGQGAVSSGGTGHNARGAGRPPGAPNRYTADVRQMVLAALDAVGGQQYLQRQALANPAIFLSLVARTMPVKVTGDPDHPIEVNVAVTVVGDMRSSLRSRLFENGE